MEGDFTQLAYVSASGAALLTVGALSFVGARRTVGLLQRLSLFGLFLALFAGITVQSLATSMVDSPPYADLFLSTNDLHIQALMEDDDLRARFNVDPRLRFIPTSGGEQVPNLDAPYSLDAGPLRHLEFPELYHLHPTDPPHGVATLAAFGNSSDLRKEVAGLYESADAAVGRPSSVRADFARDTSVGLLLLGLIGLVGGVIPLLFRVAGLARDAYRLLRATGNRAYRGARVRAFRTGLSGLAQWHFRTARPFVNLATCGLLVTLAGLLMGLAREDETRRHAQFVFREARHLKIDGKK